MEKKEVITFLSEKFKDYSTDQHYAIFDLLCQKNIDCLKLRNAMIINEYDLSLKRQISINQLYCELANKYNVSSDSIKKIIQNRKFYEIRN